MWVSGPRGPRGAAIDDHNVPGNVGSSVSVAVLAAAVRVAAVIGAPVTRCARVAVDVVGPAASAGPVGRAADAPIAAAAPAHRKQTAGGARPTVRCRPRPGLVRQKAPTPLGVPRPVGPSQPTRAVHSCDGEQDPLLPLVTSVSAEAWV